MRDGHAELRHALPLLLDRSTSACRAPLEQGTAPGCRRGTPLRRGRGRSRQAWSASGRRHPTSARDDEGSPRSDTRPSSCSSGVPRFPGPAPPDVPRKAVAQPCCAPAAIGHWLGGVSCHRLGGTPAHETFGKMAGRRHRGWSSSWCYEPECELNPGSLEHPGLRHGGFCRERDF